MGAVICHSADVKTNTPTPTGAKLSVLRQLCNLIPNHLVPMLARETGVEQKTRTFSAWSQVVSLLFGQLTHAIGLNDVCDALRLYSGPLSALRGATPPSRNNLSYANKHRDATLAEKLFWSVLEHLQKLSPGFGRGRQGKGVTRRFRRLIHIVDSTTIQLVASCMDWAKHRRRKAAAKCHLRLDLQSFLPRFAIIDTARHNDNSRAREVCAGIRAGEIVIFDKAYVDFCHLCDLAIAGIYWVTRAKENLKLRVVKRFQTTGDPRILRDDLVVLKNKESRQHYPEPMRRVVAVVEVEGREVVMEFLTNNLSWSAASVADLYRCRWSIEVFFKQIKQTLQLSDFLGHSANAVRWQVWTALLVYVLLRYQAFVSHWGHSFTRLFAIVRSVLWRKYDLRSLLESYGTAGGSFRILGTPQEAYFAGF
jgi:hypothetical protein